eukprot:scaffold5_cov169-Amphora_coffeaeformis.AAC.10
MDDNQRAANVKDPPSKPSRAFRVCQWNVHYFCGADSSGGYMQTFNAAFIELMRHDPDVIVLNEFAAQDPTENLHFLQRLEKEGFCIGSGSACCDDRLGIAGKQGKPTR